MRKLTTKEAQEEAERFIVFYDSVYENLKSKPKEELLDSEATPSFEEYYQKWSTQQEWSDNISNCGAVLSQVYAIILRLPEFAGDKKQIKRSQKRLELSRGQTKRQLRGGGAVDKAVLDKWTPYAEEYQEMIKRAYSPQEFLKWQIRSKPVWEEVERELGITVCGNTHCMEIVPPGREYCSEKCRNAAKQQRHRKRNLKPKSKSKKLQWFNDRERYVTTEELADDCGKPLEIIKASLERKGSLNGVKRKQIDGKMRFCYDDFGGDYPPKL
jgi:hypothetical protein